MLGHLLYEACPNDLLYALFACKLACSLLYLLACCLLGLIPAFLAHLIIYLVLHLKCLVQGVAKGAVNVAGCGFHCAVKVQIAGAFYGVKHIFHYRLVVHVLTLLNPIG